MSEPDISTLARRLAEQNNVDWRVLRGSGPDGKVVERDVLDYLAKVMAGEEAVNPTPEPVPEGMEAWPDQDIQGFRAGVGEAATLGELRDELGNASRDYAASTSDSTASDEFATSAHAFEGVDDIAEPAFGAASSAARFDGAHGSATVSEGGIDEDIFLFDDDGAPDGSGIEEIGAAVAASAASSMAADAMQVIDDLDDLLVAGDDFDDGGTSGSGDLAAASSEDTRFGGVSAGYLGEDDHGDGFGAQDFGVTSTGHGSASRFAADLETETPTPSSSSWGNDVSFGGASASASDQGGDVPDLWGPAATAQTDDSDLWTGPTGGAVDALTDMSFADASETGETGAHATGLSGFQTDGTQDSQPEDLSSGSWLETEAASDQDAGFAGSDAAVFASEADEPATFGEMPEADAVRDHVEDTTSDAVDPMGVGLAAVGATLLSAGTATLPLARPGTILRRNIDVSALAAAQLAVGQELGFDEPLGASAFLLRAVVKAAASTGFSTGAIGLAVLEEGVSIKRIDGAADMSFTSLVRAVASPDVDEDEPVLVAADLSGLDVDEAVLELSTPVISLGRILYDTQRGAYRSTLTLTGPLRLDSAANLLARVAELLDAPVRLVL
ncbi:MAG TPA: E3 binding domain-containing protein [Trueperaceae bacterium]|nr:E3 binding domain-containing protein [Trueperaceae bacterium]